MTGTVAGMVTSRGWYFPRDKSAAAGPRRKSDEHFICFWCVRDSSPSVRTNNNRSVLGNVDDEGTLFSLSSRNITYVFSSVAVFGKVLTRGVKDRRRVPKLHPDILLAWS